MTIVFVPKTRPLFGRVKPTLSKSLNRPSARPRPAKSPVIEASVPMTSDSTKIMFSTWRRLAPSVRSVASSRVRCAIVIEREFAITKLPTKSATPPNASRKSRRKLMNESVSAASFAACWAPVRACASGGSTPFTSCSSVVGVTPGLPSSAISSKRPVLSKSRCAVGRSKPASVAPPMVLEEPSRTVPEIRNCSTGPRACTPIVCPTSRCFLDAVLESTTTSRPCGQCPLTSVSGLNGVLPETLKPRFGAPPKAIALPSCTSDVLSFETLPWARATSGRPRSFPSRAGETVGAKEPCPLETLNAALPETTTSEPARISVLMKSNAFWIESVRTNVPLTIATPSTTASAVSAVRSLRPNMPARATRVMRSRGVMAARIAVESLRGSSSTTRPSPRNRSRSAISAA